MDVLCQLFPSVGASSIIKLVVFSPLLFCAWTRRLLSVFPFCYGERYLQWMSVVGIGYCVVFGWRDFFGTGRSLAGTFAHMRNDLYALGHS